MAMSQSTLETELLNMTPTDDEPTAITRLTDAYGVYATDAQTAITSVPITGAAVSAGEAAMSAALVGMSVPSLGAVRIQAACLAFWTAVAGLLAGAFPGAVAITPPPFAGLTALLTATFLTNTTSGNDLATSTQAIAANIHAQTLIGGTVTFPGPPPVVEPII